MSEKQYICEVLATEVGGLVEGRRDDRRLCHWVTVYAVSEEKARLTIALAYARDRYWLLEEIGCVKELTPEVKEKIDVEID
jgi:hypothetical protein